ncbi:hypothetical protein RVR_2964 [Actinacidiphila reveromycinica]|uniref:Histidine kinase/HSP90-like ATPase domain-containing protein n=1 Tax=Actinacidiphila reveromycinica TaxID=659352 RepID=A0A7U3UR61_9ACTN|nr:hypothetical protein RVR_2964 [Streptomyces sp. SN-593]
MGEVPRASWRDEASATLLVQPDPADVVVARRAVVGGLRGRGLPLSAESWGDLELLTAEVLTNAVRYSRAVCVVVVRWSEARVRVEVSDTHPVLPVPCSALSEAEGGRGLVLVEALSTRWGTELRPGGKVVWFEIAFPRSKWSVRKAVISVSGRFAETCRSVRRAQVVPSPDRREGAVR